MHIRFTALLLGVLAPGAAFAATVTAGATVTILDPAVVTLSAAAEPAFSQTPVWRVRQLNDTHRLEAADTRETSAIIVEFE